MKKLKKIQEIFDFKDKFSFVLVLIMVFLGMVLETFGVGLIVPFLEIIYVENNDNKNYLTNFLTSIPLFEGLPIAYTAVIMLLTFYTLKAIFLVFMQWRQLAYSNNIIKKYSLKLYNRYLNQSYKYYLSNNSALLIRNIYNEVGVFANGVIANSLTIITETFITLGITIMLFYYQPLLSIVIALVLVFFGSIYILFSKKYVKLWANDRLIFDGKRIKNLQEGFGAVKEIQLLGRENFFYSLFDIYNSKSVNAQLKIGFLLSIPRFLLEWMAVFILSFILIYLFFIGVNLSSVVPTIGLFLLAAFKIIPSVSRIISSYQGLSFAFPSIDQIHHDLKLTDTRLSINQNKQENQILFNNQITVDNVSFKYPSASKTSLESVNLKISHGEMVGIIGESGSGKSTFIDLLTGVFVPDEGTITVDGINITKNYRAWQNLIGYVPQNIYLSDDTIVRNIAFGIEEDDINYRKIEDVIKKTNLQNFVNDLPEGLHTKLGEKGVKMSGGQLQRIGIARALYNDPQILILDESTSALDYNTENDIMNEIAKHKESKTILIITHRTHSLINCDNVHKISSGRVVYSGSIQDLPN